MEEAGLPQSEGPPPLPYSLRQRKKSITFFWTLFVIDTLGQPLILYWALKYCTSLSLNLVFSISTAALGGISVFEYFYRLYNLMRKGSRARPLNARKSWLDFFHINFTIVWLILAVELIVGTVSPNPRVRLLAMPLPTVMFYFGGVHLTLDVLRMAGYKAPFRISSTHQGSAMPTALYVLVEDIVAVDGGGGQKFRYALRTRYLSSPYFRRMLFEMNCFWAGGSLVAAAAITVVIFTTSEDIAYTLGWSLPFAWATVWTLITFPWVQAELRREKETWNRVQHFGGGEPFTDDITVKPRTRYNSFQARILPFASREKPVQDASSPPGSSTVTDDTTTHANTTLADDTNNTNTNNNNHNNNHNHNHTNSNDNTETKTEDNNNNATLDGAVAGDESRVNPRNHDYEAQEKESKPDA